MSEESQHTLSTEVIGQLSDRQKQELNVLGATIAAQLNLNRQNPQEIEDLKEVLVDCVRRGLVASGRTWVSPLESITTFYSAGLSQRQEIAEGVNDIIGSSLANYFVITEEKAELSRLTSEKSLALSVRLDEAEELLQTINQRRAAVGKLHAELFIHSSLAPLATQLRPEAEAASRHENTQERNQYVNDRLFANFLAYFALYRQPGLDLEPKDIKALTELWGNSQVKKNAQDNLISQIEKMAQSLGIPPLAVEIYTRELLSVMSHDLDDSTTIEGLRSSIFVLIGKSIEEEREEIDTVQKAAETLYFSTDEVNSARNKYQEYRQKLVDYLKPIYALAEDEEPQEGYGEKFFKYLRQLKPLELVFILKDAFGENNILVDEDHEVSPWEELEEMVPIETYVVALPIIHAEDIKVLETGEVVGDLEKPEIKSQVKEFIEWHMVFSYLFKQENQWQEILPQLPTQTLVEFLSRLTAENLSGAQKSVIAGLSEDIWYKVCLAVDIEYNYLHVGIGDEGFVYQNFIFSPDSDKLIPYIEMLPPKTIENLAQRLKREIKLD